MLLLLLKGLLLLLKLLLLLLMLLSEVLERWIERHSAALPDASRLWERDGGGKRASAHSDCKQGEKSDILYFFLFRFRDLVAGH